MFWLCINNDYELVRIYKLITWWYKQNNIKTPHIITWADNTELSSLQYFNLINKDNVLIITTPDNILSKVISIEEFKKQSINIKSEDKINLSTLKELLVNNGYEVNTQADQVGLFSYRGFVIDIYSPQYSNPIRIELDNDIVKSLHEIDNVNKKKVKALDSIKIIPNILNSKLKESVLNIASNQNILIDQNTLIDYPEIENNNIDNIYIIQPLHEDEAKLILKNTNYFHNNLPSLKKYIANNKPEIITQNKTRVKNLFKELNINSPILEFKDFTFPGLEDVKNNKIYLTDANIFKIENIAKTKSDDIYQVDIKLGDYVVHRDHGIAKFTQTVFQTIDNIEREYFVLQYKGEDRLYLPIDQVDRISKYLGVKNPKLHRLGAASTWPQIIRKVKEDIIKMAQQLLNLYARRELSQANPLLPHIKEENELAASFPYEETEDQKQALEETLNDLTKDKPTDRLICGDVGFGKTEIAVRAAYRAVLNKQQVILLCPTTILAQQHYDTFTERFKDYDINISLLSRFVDSKKQLKNITDIKSGKTNIIIGTHRLLSKDIKFNKVGLIIIDEEQQFGVKDKEKLKDLKTEAHIIALSATPIPRTLNLSLSGVRDISVIATAPAGRLPIKTKITQFSEDIIKDAINYELARNGQVYYLYNKVETIEEQLKFLKNLLPKYTYGIVHGQLTSKEIAKTMHDFDTGKIDILICSTIIANGLDLANVNTLIVTGAQNFGLAQLYQIRGRIGRSDKQAYAYFLYSSQKLKGRSAERLQALQEAEALGSGFQIATRDMEIRGIGNILGKKQHGKVSLIGLTLYNELIKQTVSEIKTGLIPTSLIDTTIDLPINIGLPKDYLKTETSRLRYYQLLANCNNLDKLNNHFKRLPKPWPQKVKNLKSVSELRILSEQAGINLITAKSIRNNTDVKTYVYIHFTDELNYSAVKKLLDINPNWEFKDNVLKIDKDKLEKDRLESLKQAVKLFIK
ncbi:MAG: DEAD/DEAH box helicase [Candidatus Komeilibacteria bacterium]